MAPFDTTPKSIRRALGAEEIGAILRHCDEPLGLLLETAFLSGLRVNELRNLTVDHLWIEDLCGLRLDAAWTKNRQDGFQPLPRNLADRLKAHAESGVPAELYAKNLRRKDAKKKPPNRPLLYVQTTPARALDRVLEKAGISKHAPGGKIDFHACRVAYVNLVIESAATVKEAQALARHSSPSLTMNVYGRAGEKGLAATMERVAENLDAQRLCATYVQRQAVGAETENATAIGNKQLRHKTNGGAEGNRTPDLLNAIQALSQLSYSPIRGKNLRHRQIQVNRMVRRRSGLIYDQSHVQICRGKVVSGP